MRDAIAPPLRRRTAIRWRRAGLAGLAVLALAPASRLAGQPLPQYDRAKHLGVASCSSTQCHGAAQPYKEGNIRRTEYRRWSKEDKHARAYDVLLNKESRAIAAKLGLPNAHQAQVCLDCHADNVPKAQRGGRFQISDGIGCEACHGGAERWIKSHTEENVTRADNVAKGMYPTELPEARARLCLSCHYGDENKFATHRIMAAGHPRLSFELDTFTIRQEHYDIDADYRKRKTFADSVSTWASGAASAAAEHLKMLRTDKRWAGGIFPEIALFDCHACHHTMKDRRWAARATTAGLPPGAVRLNDSSLVMLYAVATTVSPGDAERLLGATRDLHDATTRSREAVVARSEELSAVVRLLQDRIRKFKFDRKAAAGVRQAIVALGAKGEFRDYSGAEQAVMAIDVLTFALGEDKKLRKDIDRLFDLLKDDARYVPADFAAALGQLRRKVGGTPS